MIHPKHETLMILLRLRMARNAPYQPFLPENWRRQLRSRDVLCRRLARTASPLCGDCRQLRRSPIPTVRTPSTSLVIFLSLLWGSTPEEPCPDAEAVWQFVEYIVPWDKVAVVFPNSCLAAPIQNRNPCLVRPSCFPACNNSKKVPRSQATGLLSKS